MYIRSFCMGRNGPVGSLELFVLCVWAVRLATYCGAAKSLEGRQGERVASILDAENGEETTVEQEDASAHGNDHGLLEVLVGLSRCSQDKGNNHKRQSAI